MDHSHCRASLQLRPVSTMKTTPMTWTMDVDSYTGEYLKSYRSRIYVSFTLKIVSYTHSTHTHTHIREHSARVCAYSRHTNRRLLPVSPLFLTMRFVCQTLSTIIIIVTVNAARIEAKKWKNINVSPIAGKGKICDAQIADCVASGSESTRKKWIQPPSAHFCVCAARLMVLLTSTAYTWVVCLLAAYRTIHTLAHHMQNSLWHVSIQISNTKEIARNWKLREKKKIWSEWRKWWPIGTHVLCKECDD